MTNEATPNEKKTFSRKVDLTLWTALEKNTTEQVICQQKPEECRRISKSYEKALPTQIAADFI